MVKIRTILVRFTKIILGAIYVVIGKPGLKKELTVFVFHDVTNKPRQHSLLSKTYCSENLFRSQIKWIKAEFKFIPLEVLGTNEASQKGAVITFDDGYQSVSTYAAPILVKEGVPFICFLNPDVAQGAINSSTLVDFISNKQGKATNWGDSNPKFVERELAELEPAELKQIQLNSGPYMSIEEIKRLEQFKNIRIGNHLSNHWYINSLSASELTAAVSKSQFLLKTLSSNKDWFATPHGQADKIKLQMIAGLGYRIIFSGKKNERFDECAIIPRIDMNTTINSKLILMGSIFIAKLRDHF